MLPNTIVDLELACKYFYKIRYEIRFRPLMAGLAANSIPRYPAKPS